MEKEKSLGELLLGAREELRKEFGGKEISPLMEEVLYGVILGAPAPATGTEKVSEAKPPKIRRTRK